MVGDDDEDLDGGSLKTKFGSKNSDDDDNLDTEEQAVDKPLSSTLSANSITKTFKSFNKSEALKLKIKKIKELQVEYRKYLLNPGPDLVVADEAHMIKQSTSKISIALNKVGTFFLLCFMHWRFV